MLGRCDRMVGIKEALERYFDAVEELSSFAFGRAGEREIEVRILYGHILKRPLPSPFDGRIN